MACCGQKRALAVAGGRAVEKKPAGRPVSRMVLFEYTGAAGMTVTGVASGGKYRFDQPGAQVQIDPRDVFSLAGLPNLRRIR